WIAGCGGGTPSRYVLEKDFDDLSFRRYQRLLDVEFSIEGNDAEAHAATYVRRNDGSDVTFANSVVTVYAHATRLAAEIRKRLDSLGTYQVTVRSLGGHHVYWLDGGDDIWALCVSGRFLIKVRAEPPTSQIPESVLD